MEIDKKVVGHRIRSIRQTKGMTLEEFGNTLEPRASRSNVSKWERGSSLPSNERLPLIAELGGMSVDDLLHGKPLWKQLEFQFNENGTLADEVKLYEVFAKVFNEDVGKFLQFIIEQLESENPNLLYNGKELNEDTKELLKNSLQSSYDLISKLTK